MRNYTIHILFLITICLFVACSTTSHLPEGEVLYTGIDKIKVHDKKGTLAEDVALEEVKAALAYKPNGALLGSSTKRSPFQVGLWIYNAYVDKPRTGFNKWFFNSFAGTPVTISKVSPDMRTKVTSNLLENYGYFRGNVDYTLVDQRDPRKQKISYDIHLGEPYLFDSIRYAFHGIQDSIIKATDKDAYIHRGTQFSTLDLTSEKDRIISAFRNNGFYYYRPDYINYYADSTNIPYRVKLLVAPDLDIPEQANRQYYIGNVSAYIRKSRTRTRTTTETRQLRGEGRRLLNVYDDSLQRRRLKIVWQGERIPIAPRVVMKNFKFRSRQMFNQSLVDKTATNLHRMDIFSSVRFTFTQREAPQLSTEEAIQSVSQDIQTNTQDSVSSPLSGAGGLDTLDVRLDLTMDQLINAEVNFAFTQKSNSQIGPAGGLTISKRNAFHHGETLSVGIRGSYEWATRKLYGEDERINSYEAGLDVSLSYPWIAFPWLNKRFYRYPTSTAFKFTIEQRKRAYYYRLMSSTIEAAYGFQTSRSWSHQLSPITITYNKMQNTTERFDSIVQRNSALYVSLRDLFIPAMQYAITYDNTWNTHIRHTMHFEGTVKESGNFLNLTNAFLGFDYYQKDKLLLSTPYSQFLKCNLQLKNTFHLTEKTSLATRVQVGAVWTYGNSNYAPYSELFYVGGANSIRAFTIRSIGPGRYYDKEKRGTYLDQSGDLKLELNAEYRFPILNAIQGALFVDAGNVWLMHDDPYHPGGKFAASEFFKDLAVGTGFGIRYDLDFLILRLDLGIGIHVPYDTGVSSYFNIRKFKDYLGFHFAVGYPF
ncbi:MAG: BamA/TamA family outer membrane protein [Bacteroidaceae bacterium]|nr:BamA/TamA family outer membrane protein [Bacteroidaceae bacterium]